MKQELNNQEDLVQGPTDSEIERVLNDSYDAPAMSRTLLKRLDRVVEQKWGVLPEAMQLEPATPRRTATGRSRVMKAWPIAASVALLVVVAVVFQNNAYAYSWTKMLDALARAEVVQVTAAEGNTTRWLSVSKGIVGERTAGKARLRDFRQGIMLERGEGAKQVTRRVVSSTTSESQRDAAVIAFLLDDLGRSDLRVTDESWSTVGDEVVLQVQLKSETESVDLTIKIDRDTHLPKSYEVAGSDSSANQVAVSYPQTDTAVFLAQDFPSDLPIVDAPSSTTVAATAADVGAASLKWKPVKATKLSSDDAVARIDAILAAVWKENGIEPAPHASDEELLRRVYLDLAGRTPSVSEVRAYLADESPDRYVKLVDRLLAGRDHATHLATVWRTYLIPDGIDLSKFGGAESFERWIGEQFIDQVPYDEVVRGLLLAKGRLMQSGPLVFYAAAKLDPDQLAKRSSRVFLGMRLDCAQCHDDHFEPWLQEDFWGYAAFFAQISRPQGPMTNVSTVLRVHDINRGEVKLPDSDDVVGPRFLDGSPIGEASVARRQQLASWLTNDKNPFFARATVNRVWSQLFGKGIVDPVDGFGIQHEPVSQTLLDHLSGYFIASNYDLRELFRAVVLSRAYRLSSGAETNYSKRNELFAQMNVKLLTAEQMYDCITVAAMLGSANSGRGFNVSRVGNARRDQFLEQFRAPPGRPTEYQAGIPQALFLMNGGLITDATGLQRSGLLKTLDTPLITNRDRVEILYMATLSRKPTVSEQELLQDFVGEDARGETLNEVLADILWALLNSAEFTMNH